MKDKSDSDYKDYIRYLRHECFNPRGVPDIKDIEKVNEMIASGEFKSADEAIEWLKNKLEPIRKDNDIALSGSDEEVIELAKRLCPKLLE